MKRHYHCNLKQCLLFLIIFLLLVLPATVWSAFHCFNDKWPSEYSEFQPDPSLERGKLANGLRYVFKQNQEPENRVTIFLQVKVGSLYEREDEKGMSHYLEHMLFNGSTNFPPGEMVTFFQQIGMSFGGDTNAYTTYDETVYRVNLPDGTPELLRKGLLVMADFARGGLLIEKEIDRERGVILAEMLERNSVGYQVHLQKNRQLYSGSRLADRPVIGTEEVIRAIDREAMKAFYDRWYRPENMTLVVVGDISAHDVVPLIAEQFGSLESGGERPQCPDFGELTQDETQAIYVHEPDLGRTEVKLTSIDRTSTPRDSLSRRAEELYRLSASMIMNERLRKIVEAGSHPVTRLYASSGDMLGMWQVAEIGGVVRDKSWQQAITLLDTELRSALQYGFSAQEVETARQRIKAILESAVRTSESRNSGGLARNILNHLEGNLVFLSPEQELELYSPLLASMTREKVQSIFQKDWGSNKRTISVLGDVAINGSKPDKTILANYFASQKREVAKVERDSVGTFPYLEVNEPSEELVRERLHFDDLDVTRVVYDNNIVLNVKRTDYEPNRVRMVISVGNGKVTQPQPGMVMVAESVINESGTATMSASELRNALAGKTVNLSFRSGGQDFRWTGSALRDDLDLLIQLGHAKISDLGFRKSAYQLVMERFAQMYNRVENDIHSSMDSKVRKFLAGGDTRIGLPERAEMNRLNFQQVEGWIRSQLDDESVEISIIGDVDVSRVIPLISRYFGQLPERKKDVVIESSLDFPAGQSLQVHVDSAIDKSMIVVSWPTAGIWDIERTRRLNMLANVFQERVRVLVREELGASYSQTVVNEPSMVYGDYGKLFVRIFVKPGDETTVAEKVVQIADELRLEGVSEEELKRAKDPVINKLKDRIETNQYWLYNVMVNSTRYPQKLDWAHSMLSDYQAITPEEIHAYAKQYLHPGSKALVIVTSKQQS